MPRGDGAIAWGLLLTLVSLSMTRYKTPFLGEIETTGNGNVEKWPLLMIWKMGTVIQGHVFACNIVIKTKDKVTENQSHSEIKVVINSKSRNILLSEKCQTKFDGYVTCRRNRNHSCVFFIEDSGKTMSEGKNPIICGNYPQTPRKTCILDLTEHRGF